MRIREPLHQLKDDRIENNEARLLKKAAAELSRRFNRRMKDTVGELRQRAVRLPGDQRDPGPFVFRDAREMEAHLSLARSRDDTKPVAGAYGRGGGFADEMRVAAHMHEAHRRHLRDEA